PSVVVANPDAGPVDLDQLVSQARGNPVPVATCGNGTPQHLAVQMLHAASHAQFQHITYWGCGPALKDVLARVVPAGVITLSSAIKHVQAGTLRALAVTAPQRAPVLADTPTVAEQGYPGYELNQWHGLMVPAGVRTDILDFLSATLADI